MRTARQQGKDGEIECASGDGMAAPACDRVAPISCHGLRGSDWPVRVESAAKTYRGLKSTRGDRFVAKWLRFGIGRIGLGLAFQHGAPQGVGS